MKVTCKRAHCNLSVDVTYNQHLDAYIVTAGFSLTPMNVAEGHTFSALAQDITQLAREAYDLLRLRQGADKSFMSDD